MVWEEMSVEEFQDASLPSWTSQRNYFINSEHAESPYFSDVLHKVSAQC